MQEHTYDDKLKTVASILITPEQMVLITKMLTPILTSPVSNEELIEFDNEIAQALIKLSHDEHQTTPPEYENEDIALTLYQMTILARKAQDTDFVSRLHAKFA